MTSIALKDRVALVTGAARGIGHATVRRFLEAGSFVVLNARSESAASAAAIEALSEDYPGRVVAAFGDVSASDTVETLRNAVRDRFGRLDILVNNAGILRDNLIGMIPDDEVERVLATNIGAPLRLTQMAAGLMSERRKGSIVNLASIIGRRGNPGQLVYGASKAAVIGATKVAAKELAHLGVRVNAVAPGLIDTPMIEAIPPAGRMRLEKNIGMGRIGTAEDVADVILFLASDLSSYVTGQVLGVDGGLVL